MSERPANSYLNSVLRRLFLVCHTPSVILGTITKFFGVASADRFPQLFEPDARPREFDTQNREPHGNYNNSGPRRHDHNQPNQQHGHAYGRNDDSTSRFVSEVHRSLDQNLPHNS